jgi:DNA-directed RNA polymerase I and III subunit RPAC2
MVTEAKLLEQVQATDDAGSVTCKTFIFHGESHSLGNALRWMLMKNPDVAFCGYNIPHPTENKIQLTIQTTGVPAEDALKKGLEDLHKLFGHVLNMFEVSVAAHRSPPE